MVKTATQNLLLDVLGDGYHRDLLSGHISFETKDGTKLVESLQKLTPKLDTYGLLAAEDDILDGVERIFLHKNNKIMLNDDEEEENEPLTESIYEMTA